MGIFNDANPALHAGRDLTVRELLSANEDKLIDRLSGDPALQADVLHSVAQVWDRFGDLGRVVEIHDKRAGLLDGNGASPGAVAAALLEQAHALAVVGRLQDIPPLLDRVRVLSPVEGMPDELRERYEWLRGWIALNVGEQRDARAHYGRALEAARRTGDTGAQVRALYGRSASETFVNRVAPDRDRAAALRDHREAARLLEGSSLDRLQRYDQWYQLLVNLFWLGEYREGWPLVRQQMIEADQLFGEFAPASAPLQFFHTVYLWRLGRPQEALDWLAARERHRRRSGAPQASSPPSPPSREAALEARLWTALGRAREAREPLDRWRAANPDPSTEDLLRIGLAELERSQSFADADEVLRLLSQKPWNTLTGEDDSEWPLYPLWHRGIALERQGDRESALPLLEAAVRKAQRSGPFWWPRWSRWSRILSASCPLTCPRSRRRVCSWPTCVVRPQQKTPSIVGGTHKRPSTPRKLAIRRGSDVRFRRASPYRGLRINKIRYIGHIDTPGDTPWPPAAPPRRSPPSPPSPSPLSVAPPPTLPAQRSPARSPRSS
jgi:tetratricopeptide (TPR) repeat protein